ncbi:MAG: hypothetical protein D6694_12280 [Gammaproteobacteria bacterium]|nr:MAG: hypothetical protein D6694_12280 [Gammaproteobacteria bacterium]
MTRKSTKNLSLTPAEKRALRALAREWGFIIGRGPMAAEGSIDTLVSMLAAGSALFVPIGDDYELHPDVAARLDELAEAEQLPLLSRVATALRRAEELDAAC